MSWEKVKLSNVSTDIQTGPFGSQLHQSDYSETGTPVVMPKDLINGKISEESIARVPSSHVERLKKHKIKTGDILYSRRGDVGRCAFATVHEENWLCGTGCLRVTVDELKANPKFVFYQLQKAETIGWVVNHAVGATMLNLNTSILSDVPLELPDLKTQHRIVDMLSAYDDLIENNQKQIKLLEEAAQRLYKEWFVDLRFPGYEECKIVDGVPEGWEKRFVGDMLKKIPKTEQIKASEYMKSGSIPVIDQSKNFVAGYTNNQAALIEENLPIIVFGDHTRVLKYISFPFAKGADGTQLVLTNNIKRMPQALLYCSLINIDLSNYHYARHFKYLKAEEILVPIEDIAEQFNTAIQPIYELVQKKRDQCMRIAEVRDRMLPKLMSGEIEV